MFKTIAKLLKNPRARQLLIWVAPMVIGWLFDRSKNGGKTTPKASSRKKTK